MPTNEWAEEIAHKFRSDSNRGYSGPHGRIHIKMPRLFMLDSKKKKKTIRNVSKDVVLSKEAKKFYIWKKSSICRGISVVCKGMKWWKLPFISASSLNCFFLCALFDSYK